MNYQETLNYLLEKLPMFQRVGQAAIKKDLSNTYKLLQRLGNPEKQFPAIHIAGTNGKGSLSHMLGAIMIEEGYKTGLYTSPHLLDFRERMRINGHKIPEDSVIDFVQLLKPTIEEVKPSFFEVTVAMAFYYFAHENVDIAVIETGLGGRLDSTNVIKPEVSVITNVSLDHQYMLGDTLAEIATEKAGILKNGVPAIIGEKDIATQKVFEEKAKALNAPLAFVPNSYSYLVKGSNADYLNIHILKNDAIIYKNLQCDLPGFYQANNITTAIATIESLKIEGWEVTDSSIQKGLAKVKSLTGLKGRWEKLKEKPLTICDIAHNESAVKWHRHQLEAYTFQNLHIILGMTREKAIENIVATLPPFATYYFCQPDIPRALESNYLKAKAALHSLNGKAYQDVKTALEASEKNANPEDLILITGSAFVVAEALQFY